ncbi:MarR family transcriptional regulator [Frankia sp. AiPs1]|uniref:hypothetical protein n=1 Tax=Frankia sp. AiPa1 TaxID=573492 RepID=UPI00202B4FD2|nr:hypothetical protein [Frankia sp. AiPa1]MCL9758795.1 hypothetical protein [Frankia sp. AiPa1]
MAHSDTDDPNDAVGDEGAREERDAIRRAVRALPPMTDEQISQIAALLSLTRTRRSPPAHG